MEKIIFGFSKPKTWKPFAWIIMIGLGIEYSHTYIKIYSEKYERWLIYQASGVMVNFMNIETFNEHAKIVEEIEFSISQETKSKVMIFSIDNCGKPYGLKSVFGLAIVRFFELFGKTIKNPFSDGLASFPCSELVSDILNEMKESLPKSPDDMTPKDVFDFCLAIKKINSCQNTNT